MVSTGVNRAEDCMLRRLRTGSKTVATFQMPTKLLTWAAMSSRSRCTERKTVHPSRWLRKQYPQLLVVLEEAASTALNRVFPRVSVPTKGKRNNGLSM